MDVFHQASLANHPEVVPFELVNQSTLQSDPYPQNLSWAPLRAPNFSWMRKGCFLVEPSSIRSWSYYLSGAGFPEEELLICSRNISHDLEKNN